MNVEKILNQYSLLSRYYDIFANREKYKCEVELITKFLSKYDIKQVLDIGCGTGLHSLLLVNKGFHVIGVDISNEMIKQAKKNTNQAKFFVMDMRNLNLNKKIDAGMYLHSFYYLITSNDINNALKSLNEHLNPGGIVIIFNFSILNSILSNSFQTKYLLKEKSNSEMERTIIIEHKIDSKKYTCYATEHHFIRENNKVKNFICKAEYRIFTLNEIILHLEKNGFRSVYSHSYSSRIFKDHILIVAQKVKNG